MMNLREFIREALVEIITGVAEARAEVAKHGALVASNTVHRGYKEVKITVDDQDRTVSVVEFDIALANADSKDTKGGIGVFLGSVGLGSQGASHDETSSSSRIKFAVPVIFPGKGHETMQ